MSADPSSGDDDGAADVDPATVLIVEDEENVAEAYRLWLDREYEVRTAIGGEAGVEAVDGDVDVVLLDRRMPGVSGDEVLDRIREGPHDPKVAMVTAVDPDFDIIEMPFETYLTKPVTREELTDVVERLLTLREYGQQAREHFALSEKRATLAENKTREQLKEDEEYQELTERLEELSDEMRDAMADADDDTVEAMFRDIGDN